MAGSKATAGQPQALTGTNNLPESWFWPGLAALAAQPSNITTADTGIITIDTTMQANIHPPHSHQN